MSKRKSTAPELRPRLQSELADSNVVQPIEAGYARIKHSVNPGDLIACMGAIKRYYDVTKRKVIVCQATNQLAQYYQGAVHPTVNDKGQNVCCNDRMWEMLKPLVESQYYIHRFEKYNGQQIDLDFDVIRGKTFVNLPNGMIQNWIVFAFPDLATDLSKPWITLDGKCPKHIEKQVKGKVILNFTERYRNNMMDYFYLKNYQSDLIFAGTEKEHWLFCNQWQLNIPRLEDKNFLETAYALRECRFFVGNQSTCWNLAEALKIPRSLEICQFAPNCQPGVGENSFGYLHQVGNEYYFRKLYNITSNK
jgi:hypothetical protein